MCPFGPDLGIGEAPIRAGFLKGDRKRLADIGAVHVGEHRTTKLWGTSETPAQGVREIVLPVAEEIEHRPYLMACRGERNRHDRPPCPLCLEIRMNKRKRKLASDRPEVAQVVRDQWQNIYLRERRCRNPEIIDSDLIPKPCRQLTPPSCNRLGRQDDNIASQAVLQLVEASFAPTCGERTGKQLADRNERDGEHVSAHKLGEGFVRSFGRHEQ